MPTPGFHPIPRHVPPRRRTHAQRRADNAALANPKPLRHRDEAARQWCRDLQVCEWCGRPGPTDCSHTRGVGAGGGDEYTNVTGLCRPCHDEHHRGHEPTAEQLRWTAARRERFGRDRAAGLAMTRPAWLAFTPPPTPLTTPPPPTP